MFLKRLVVKKLYGYLDLDIPFNEDVTILIGINGCGKTSALNVVDWLLKGDYKRLAVEYFESLNLEVDHEGDSYTIVAEKTGNMLVFSIASNVITIPFKPITVELLTSAMQRRSRADASLYAQLSLEPHEMPMWNFLESLPNPTVISLDRQLSAEANDVIYSDSWDVRPDKIVKKTPIAHVQQLMNRKFTEYRAKASQHDNELKARILMTAFQDPMNAFGRSHIKPMRDEEIAKLELKVIKHLSNAVMADEVTKHVRQFFKSSRTLAKQLAHEPSDQNFAMGFMLLRYRQIETLAKAFNDLEVKNTAAFSDLKHYLDALNVFFHDSGKQLYFDEATNGLAFRTLNRLGCEGDSSSVADGDITNLSSGEQQILILFTFLSFVAKSGSVFIVDEPELSLHPKWQYDFMKSFLGLRPRNTQILLATHSPEIVGRFKSSCVLL